MRFTRLAATLAILSAGTAYAGSSSPIPANYVDDFGGTASASSARIATDHPAGHASMIPGNQIDDFGAQVTVGGSLGAFVPPGHASIIPGNQIDDFETAVPAASARAAVATRGEAPAPRS